MFVPTTRDEMNDLGWDAADVILITGDTYIDSPFIGVAVIGRWLMKHGFTVGIIAQPSIKNGDDIRRLGVPRLFWGVTAGCIDSMVANYTASKKFRQRDDYTPGGVNIRPNRATIAYTNLIRRYHKNTRPIVLGGVEASLRRIAHYDFYDNAVRRSILLDAKADILAYGMAEQTVIALAKAFREGTDWHRVPGICFMAAQGPETYKHLPSYEEVTRDTAAYMRMARAFARLGMSTTTGFIQAHGKRFLVHNPAPEPLTTADLDAVYEMNYQHDVHPYYRTGKVKALDTIRQSVTAHRGCFGQCHFCAIAVHQGRRIISRSPESIVREVKRYARTPGFNGIIYDIGGPTANMYGVSCRKDWRCQNKHCLTPRICPNLQFGHREQLDLLTRVMNVPGVKKVFIASGIRHDLVLADKKYGVRYVDQLVRHHVSGQIKLAPEHSEPQVLRLMNKPPVDALMQFRKQFNDASKRAGKKWFMTYYLMAAHPGCTPQQMRELNRFLINRLKVLPEQVQIFTPTPGTLSTAMFYCGTDLNGRSIYCENTRNGMVRQKTILRGRSNSKQDSRQRRFRQKRSQ